MYRRWRCNSTQAISIWCERRCGVRDREGGARRAGGRLPEGPCLIEPLDKAEVTVQLKGMSDPGAHPIYDVLKDFQPALAGAIALVAACIAYFGATAKVRFDKRVGDREFERERLGLYLRLRYEVDLVATLLSDDGSYAKSDRDLADPNRSEEKRADFAETKRLLEQTPEITAAWQKLQIIPVSLGDSIDELRRGMFRVALALDTKIYPVFPAPDADQAIKFSGLCRDAQERAIDLRSKLDAIIAATAKKIEEFR
jgi:hypothetical protein